GWFAVLIRSDVRRDCDAEVSPARQVSCRIDLLRLTLVGITALRPVWIGVAVVAARRIDEVAAEADQCLIPGGKFQLDRGNLETTLDLALIVGMRSGRDCDRRHNKYSRPPNMGPYCNILHYPPLFRSGTDRVPPAAINHGWS